MNSLERVEAALNIEQPDRVPVSGMGWTIGAIAGGLRIPEYARDGKKMAKGQLAFLEKTGVDILHPTSDVGQIAEGWGTTMRYTEEVTPLLDEFAVKEPEDWEKLEVLDPKRDGRMHVTIDAVDMIVNETKNSVAVIPYVPSPLTSATHVRAMEEVMVDIILYPDLLHKGLEVIADSTVEYINACNDAGAQGVLYSPTRASAEITTLEQYREFGEKYDYKVLKALKKQGALNIHHVCGIEPFFDDLISYPNTKGINWWDRGAKPNLKEAKQKYGDRICLMGGLDQTTTLVMGTPADVENEAKDAIEAAKAGGGFILAPGCEISPKASLESIKAAVRTAEKYGR